MVWHINPGRFKIIGVDKKSNVRARAPLQETLVLQRGVVSLHSFILFNFDKKFNPELKKTETKLNDINGMESVVITIPEEIIKKQTVPPHFRLKTHRSRESDKNLKNPT